MPIGLFLAMSKKRLMLIVDYFCNTVYDRENLKRSGIVSDLVLREPNPEDMPAIMDIVRDVWAWEEVFESDEVVEASVAMYLAPVLHEASFGRVAVLDGNVVGVIFGAVDDDEPCFKHLLYDLTPYMITLLKTSEEERLGFCGYISKMRDVYERLVSGIEQEYDGTLDFFATCKSAQGKGIGKQLWLELKAYFEEKNVKRIYLYSDSECNFGFYERQGFKKRRQDEVRYEFDGEVEISEQYLYEYKLA